MFIIDIRHARRPHSTCCLCKLYFILPHTFMMPSRLLTNISTWTRSIFRQIKDDLRLEFNLDIEVPSQAPQSQRTRTFQVVDRNNYARRPPSSDSDDSDSDDKSEDALDYDENGVRINGARNCCMFCACLEKCSCFEIPGVDFLDAYYDRLQERIDECPVACPTLIPRRVEEEWRFKGGYGARFALSECCSSPECIICLKWFDTICCLCCAVWEMIKGMDFGYRRFRIQAYIHRHNESSMGIKTIWV